MDKKDNVFRLGELFCGPGGLACGALRAKSDDGTYTVEHVWASITWKYMVPLMIQKYSC